MALVCACAREPAPSPSFQPVFPALATDLATFSSPWLADLNRDGVADIVFGTGVDRIRPEAGRYIFGTEPDVPGYVVAVSGATNEVLWRAPNPGDAHTIPRFLYVNRDSVPDVLMGGREGAFAAFNGRDGGVLWRINPAHVAKTPVPFNFFTPGIVADVNRDAVDDIIVMYGGDDTRLPGEPRDPGYIVLVSGADGGLLAVQETPDRKESYAGIVVYERPDGAQWFIFGTGGETDGGAAYRAPVVSLLDGTFSQRVQRLGEPGPKGVMAPATLVELTGDSDPDIVISGFDGRLFAVHGATGELLWEESGHGEETYHSAAVMRISRSGRLGLFVSLGTGEFPRYTGSVHRLHDAQDGKVLFQTRNDFAPAGAPLAVELTKDGIDELFFFSMRYPRGHGGRIHILHGPSKTLLTHDVPANLATTPVIADVRGTGRLELIALAWDIKPGTGTPSWRDLRSQLIRLDLSAPAPEFRAWAGYMGTGGNGRFTPAEAAPRP